MPKPNISRGKEAQPRDKYKTIVTPLEYTINVKLNTFLDPNYTQNCGICFSEGYFSKKKPVFEVPLKDVLDMQSNFKFGGSDNLILLKDCKDHFFHDACLKGLISSMGKK